MKKLTLSKETIRDLSSSDLDRVGGATGYACNSALCSGQHTVSVPNCICAESACICVA